jgi:carbamoyltransferase
LTKWGGRAIQLALERALAARGLYGAESKHARTRVAELERRIRAGEGAYVLGVNTRNHNAGAALVRISERGRIDIICNEEEERYKALKHYGQYPDCSIEIVKQRMRALGVGPEDLAACVSTANYATGFNIGRVNPLLEEAPASLAVLWRERSFTKSTQPELLPGRKGSALFDTPAQIGRQLGLAGRMPVIGVRHHDTHAYFSYAVSPFAASAEPTMIVVADAAGDDCTTSTYLCHGGQIKLLSTMGTSRFDSLGTMYMVLSVTQGGWPPLSAEGRYMGATAWGDGSRLTNPYYRRLKYIFHLAPEGQVHINREFANWVKASLDEPYSKELIDIIGEPIAPEYIWNPDAVLNVEDVHHPEVTRDRVDKAAAVQMVFEDALMHIVEHVIRTTSSHQLILTGGTALNCVANTRLLECFGEDWYSRNLGLKKTRLHLWVPPVPGDAGAPVGAAYAFAMRAGAQPGSPLQHAFHCGLAPATAAIRAALRTGPQTGNMSLGDCSKPDVRARTADLLAYLVADDLIVGLYQGVAETGPRALGHRSILANPCNPDTRRLLNERVKHRELIRPLAPMCTLAAAKRFFYLEDGVSDDEYNAYNYMVLTARARPEAHETIPAVIHHDGTGRLQIVRPATDPFCHEFLRAMGRRAEVEVSVNTSLNVGAPIAHTPEHAVQTLDRARGMDGLLMIGDDGEALLVWLTDRTEARERLTESLRAWEQETSFELPEPDLVEGV